jgi:uncharacterized membrane protein YagU involved in acid resistance
VNRSPLPPATLTKQILDKTGAGSLGPASLENATMASHLGFSLAAGVIYSWVNSLAGAPADRLGAIGRGTAFGVFVWSASYLGWIEVLGLRPRATNLKPARNAMMFINHLLWGAALGYAERELTTRAGEMLDGRRKRKGAE